MSEECPTADSCDAPVYVSSNYGKDIEWYIYNDRLFMNNRGIQANNKWTPSTMVPKADDKWIASYGELTSDSTPFNTGGCSKTNGELQCRCYYPKEVDV